MLLFLLYSLLTAPLPGMLPAGVDEPRDSAAAARHPLRAAGLTISVNAAMSLFDRAFLPDPCYKSDWNNICNNFHSDWVWDNDGFYRNQLGHPVQGAMYYNAARMSGLGYWGGGLATVLGSVSWELLCETDPPSINDLLTTTAGGMAVGEVLWRLYHLTGKRKPVDFPFRISAGVGAWGLTGIRSTGTDMAAGARALLDVEYGDPFDTWNRRPYDWFTLTLRAGLGSGNTSGIQNVGIIGLLYGWPLRTASGNDMLVGLFQHFNYFDSPGMDISESSSFGPGIVMRFKDGKGNPNTEFQAHAGAILMGGIQSDYYNVLERTYNMSGGFSLHGRVSHNWGKTVAASLRYDCYQLYTAKEYDQSFLDGGGDPLLLDAQGNKMTSHMDIIRMQADIRCSDCLTIRIEPGLICRRSRYAYHPDIFRSYADLTLGICWQIR